MSMPTSEGNQIRRQLVREARVNLIVITVLVMLVTVFGAIVGTYALGQVVPMVAESAISTILVFCLVGVIPVVSILVGVRDFGRLQYDIGVMDERRRAEAASVPNQSTDWNDVHHPITTTNRLDTP